MMTWFNSREPRERVLLLILAGLLIVFAAWFVMSRDRGPDGSTALEAAQTDREFWLRAAPKLNSNTATGARAEFTRGALIEAARKRGVDLSRVQPQAGGGLTLWVEDASTPAFYAIIQDLVSNYAVDVDTALITAAASGGVNAQLTLTPI
ncbi:MAG: type II secretion system protein GspM [Litorimonas sp.]